MASVATGSSDRRPQRYSPSPVQGSSDGRGGEAIGTSDTSGRRYIYYRLYTKDGPITTNNLIYVNNNFISRTLLKLIAPPRTALSVKKHLCKIEGLSGATSSTLFESLSSQTAVAESFRLSVKEYSGPGLSENDPIVLVVGVEDAENRSVSTAVWDGLPEAVTPGPRYVYYCLYDEDGAIVSRTSFDSDDSSLGRIDTLSIAPPQTVSSMRCKVMKTEGLVNQQIQLFEDMDGEVPMNDNDHISFQAQGYPGHLEGQPISIVCSQESTRKDEESQKKAPVNQVDPSFSKQIKGMCAKMPHISQPGWLAFDKDEIMSTNGTKTTGFIIGDSHTYHGYTAINSAGEKGFVHEGHVVFC